MLRFCPLASANAKTMAGVGYLIFLYFCSCFWLFFSALQDARQTRFASARAYFFWGRVQSKTKRRMVIDFSANYVMIENKCWYAIAYRSEKFQEEPRWILRKNCLR
jgi:hypothetical protein